MVILCVTQAFIYIPYTWAQHQPALTRNNLLHVMMYITHYANYKVTLRWNHPKAKCKRTQQLQTLLRQQFCVLLRLCLVVCKRMRQIPTTPNDMQKSVQTDATCNIQHMLRVIRPQCCVCLQVTWDSLDMACVKRVIYSREISFQLPALPMSNDSKANFVILTLNFYSQYLNFINFFDF